MAIPYRQPNPKHQPHRRDSADDVKARKRSKKAVTRKKGRNPRRR